MTRSRRSPCVLLLAMLPAVPLTHAQDKGTLQFHEVSIDRSCGGGLRPFPRIVLRANGGVFTNAGPNPQIPDTNCNSGSSIRIDRLSVPLRAEITGTLGPASFTYAEPVSELADATITVGTTPINQRATGFLDGNVAVQANCPTIPILQLFDRTTTFTIRQTACRRSTSGLLGVPTGETGRWVLLRTTLDVSNSSIDSPRVNIVVTTWYRFEQPPQLSIDHVQIVQALQSPDMGVRLIQGKDSIVRVFPRSTGPNARDVTGVLGEVRINGQPLVKFPNPPTATAPAAKPDPAKIQQSLNFILPGNLTRAVGLAVEARVWIPDTAGARQGLVTSTRTFAFEPSKWPDPFVVGRAKVCTMNDAGAVTCPQFNRSRAGLLDVFWPSPRSKFIQLPFLQRTVHESVVTPSDQRLIALLTILLVRDFLNAFHLLDTHTPGLLPPIERMVYDVAGMNADVFDNTFGDPNFGPVWLSTPANDNALHGLGHSYGLAHYDANSTSPLSEPPAALSWVPGRGPNPNEPRYEGEARDGGVDGSMMYDLAPEFWISGGEFNKLHELGPGQPPVQGASVRAAGEDAETIVISGTVARDNSAGTLDRGFRGPGKVAPPPSKANGDTCLRFTRAAGDPVDYCFNAIFPKTGNTGYFGVAAPYPAGTVSVVLRRGGRDLATLRAGTPPTVSIIAPVAGDQWIGTRKIRWSATGESLIFNVHYSADNGATWLPLASDLTATEYEVDTGTLLGGRNVHFRVVASTGLDNGSATVGPVEVVQDARLAAPTAVDFGNATIGQTVTREIAIANSGAGLLRAAVTPPDNALFTTDAPPVLFVRPGEPETVSISFLPVAAGAQRGTLRIGEQSIALTGAAFANTVASIALSAQRLDFGNVTAGSTKDVTLVVTNEGLAQLTINTLTLSNAAFRVMSPAAPVNVAAGATANVVVRHTAAGATEQSGRLTIASNDPTRPQVELVVAGTSVAGVVPTATAAGVVSAASFLGGSVAAGQIVTIFGTTIGPAALAGLRLNAQGLVDTTVGETRVLFDGVPAPIIYALAGQTSVIVPYAVAGRTTTQMVVEYQGRRSDPVTLQVAPSAPGLFSANSSGRGPGAILNQDSSVNAAGNPAEKGSVVVLFGTGEGRTEPDGVDGRLASSVFPKPRLPVSVRIGGAPAEVLYAGAAPGLVAGVFQINARIPEGVVSGAVPVVVTVGSAASQEGLTVAVR